MARLLRHAASGRGHGRSWPRRFGRQWGRGGHALPLPHRGREYALGNAAVLLAAMGVFGTGTGWPDVVVAAIMGGLGLWGGWQIVHQARGELHAERAPRTALAAE